MKKQLIKHIIMTKRSQKKPNKKIKNSQIKRMI